MDEDASAVQYCESKQKGWTQSFIKSLGARQVQHWWYLLSVLKVGLSAQNHQGT